MTGPGAQTGGARRRALRRAPPRHRRPPQRRRLAQSAGLAAMGCGALAIALGAGGWALAGQHHGSSPPPHTAASSRAGTAGRPVGPGGAGVSGPHRRRTTDGLVPVPGGLSSRGISGHRQQRVPKPTRLVIPAIGVRTNLIRLGMTRHGTLQVPASAAVAGWFTGSPRPGGIGPSIIAGHIDSRSGPGVFFRLRDLHRGEKVYVSRANGSVATFRITAVRTYAKSRFPTAAVYGPVPDAELRLITCGGQFDQATGSYLSNVVAYAVLVR